MGFKDSIEEDHEHYASSSPSPPSSDSSSGPLYELADLMDHLPIKRGLSKFYNGKSQTFASLMNVESVEDLGKKEMMSFSRRMKSCKSFGGSLNVHQKLGPKATIAKRSQPFAAKTTFFLHTYL